MKQCFFSRLHRDLSCAFSQDKTSHTCIPKSGGKKYKKDYYYSRFNVPQVVVNFWFGSTAKSSS